MGKVVGVWLMLLLCVATALADTASDQQQVQTAVDASNRFLAAETAKAIKASGDEVAAQLIQNNDANFIEFDKRMNQLMQDTRLQVIIGGIGSILVANALVGIMLAVMHKRYSLEYYQQQLLGKQSEEIDRLRSMQEMQGFNQMQQQSWQIQEPAKTLGTEFGQAAVGQVSQMNAWQMQPTYQGAWQAPQENVQRYVPPLPQYQDYDEPVANNQNFPGNNGGWQGPPQG